MEEARESGLNRQKRRRMSLSRYLLKCLLFLLIVTMSMGMLMFAAVWIIPGLTYSYMAAWPRQYDHLLEAESPKVVFAGGSSNAFGIDAKTIEGKIGLPVVNTGLHAGLGLKTNAEFVLNGIEQGDIVLLVMEVPAIDFLTFNASLMWTGTDKRVDVLRDSLKPEFITEYMRGFPWYLFAKIAQILEGNADQPPYTIESFDNLGNMIFNRPERVMEDVPEPGEDMYFHANEISDDGVAYLIEYKKMVEERGGTLFILPPPIMRESRLAEDNIGLYFQTIEEKTGIKCISHYTRHIIDFDLFYDNIHHLNDQGALVRSELIAEDLNNYIKERE